MKTSVKTFVGTFILYGLLSVPPAFSEIPTGLSSDYKTATSKLKKVGDSTPFGLGTLTLMPNSVYEFKSKSPDVHINLGSEQQLEYLARVSPAIRFQWMETYGLDVIGLSQSYKMVEDLFIKSGPNAVMNLTSVPFPVYKLKYDANGLPKEVIKPDGTIMSLADFKATKLYAALIGKNSPSYIASKSKPATAPAAPAPAAATASTSSTSSSSAQVGGSSGAPAASTATPCFVTGAGQTCDTKTDGKASFGPGDSTASAPATKPVPKTPAPLITKSPEIPAAEYRKAVFGFASVPYSMLEVGEKQCKPAGEGYTKSLVDFWSANGNYIKVELARDALIAGRTALLQKKVVQIVKDSDGALQIEGLKLQHATGAINLDASTGSSTFTLDNNQKAVTETAGVPQLEKLISKAQEAIAENEKDHKDMVATWEHLMKGIAESAKVAASACDRKKQVEVCRDVTQSHVECSIVEQKDPVPGSCEMNALLHPYQNTTVKQYADTYFMEMPSTDLNKEMERLEKEMKDKIASFPVSDDSNYDWTTPLTEPQMKMADTRKKYGILCPNGAPKDGEKSNPEGAKLNETAVAFLKPLGVEGEVASEGSKTMVKNWSSFDLVIGLPGKRGEFYNKTVKLMNEYMKIEQLRIKYKSMDQESLQKAIDYYQKQMSGGSNVAKSSCWKMSSALSMMVLDAKCEEERVSEATKLFAACNIFSASPDCAKLTADYNKKYEITPVTYNEPQRDPAEVKNRIPDVGSINGYTAPSSPFVVGPGK